MLLLLLLVLVLPLLIWPSLRCLAFADPLSVPGVRNWSSSSSSRSSQQTHATPANDGRLQMTTAATAVRTSSSMVRGFTLQHYFRLLPLGNTTSCC